MLTVKCCAKCKVDRPVAEFARDGGRKDGLQPYCKPCNRAYRTASTARIATYREENRGYYREKNAEWRAANPGKVREANVASYRASREQNIKRVREWQRANPEKHCEIQVRRYASIKSSQPAWADRAEIIRVYKAAAQMRKAGLDVHVDHVVPLRSKRVCGLHVAANLQIIDRKVNVIKNNRHWPDMF